MVRRMNCQIVGNAALVNDAEISPFSCSNYGTALLFSGVKCTGCKGHDYSYATQAHRAVSNAEEHDATEPRLECSQESKCTKGCDNKAHSGSSEFQDDFHGDVNPLVIRVGVHFSKSHGWEGFYAMRICLSCLME